MTTFEECIETVLANEGGYINSQNDPGGETNFGISKRKYPYVDIKNLTRDGAKELYKNDYWNKLYEQLDKRVATMLLDMSVLSGGERNKTAISFFQAAIVDAGHVVSTDGVFGPKTLEAALKCNPADLCYRFGNIMARFHFKIARDRIQSGKYDRKELQAQLYSWIKRDFA